MKRWVFPSSLGSNNEEKKHSDYILRASSEIVAILPDRELALRYLNHECADGDYYLKGPGLDMVFYRIHGKVYPGGGTIDEEAFSPRSKEQCVETFGRNPGEVN